MDLIHYGSSKFDPSKFRPVTPRNWVKPSGGFWASPVDSAYGWRQWCKDEQFNLGSLKRNFKVTCKGEVLTIDSVEDLRKMPWNKDQNPDWDKILKSGIDAIHLTVNGQIETRFSNPFSLYGWDCESVLVINPSALSTL